MSAASKMVSQFCEANGICVRCKCNWTKKGEKLCYKCIAYILSRTSSSFAKRLIKQFGV